MDVASRELRNNTRHLLDRVQAGEAVTITLNGKPVAVLKPIERRSTWVKREDFIRDIVPHQADKNLRRELQELLPDTTDDAALR